MRYYFHVRFDDDLIADDEGIELENDERAREEAIKSAAELALAYPKDKTRAGPQSISVVDETGQELFVVPIELR